MSTTPYLLDEKTIPLSPSLASALGINEALIFQQIHYWVGVNEELEKEDTHYYEGKWWMYNSYEQWRKRKFGFLSYDTIRRVIGALEDLGLIISRLETDTTGNTRKWYTIDYEAYKAFIELWQEWGKPIYGSKETKADKVQQKAEPCYVARTHKNFIESWQAKREDRGGVQLAQGGVQPTQGGVQLADTYKDILHKSTSVSNSKDIPPTPFNDKQKDDTPPKPLVETKPAKAKSKKQSGAGDDISNLIEPSEWHRWVGFVLCRLPINKKAWTPARFAMVDGLLQEIWDVVEERNLQDVLQPNDLADFHNWYKVTYKRNGDEFSLPRNEGKVADPFTRWLDIAYAPPKPAPIDIEITYRSIQL